MCLLTTNWVLKALDIPYRVFPPFETNILRSNPQILVSIQCSHSDNNNKPSLIYAETTQINEQVAWKTQMQGRWDIAFLCLLFQLLSRSPIGLYFCDCLWILNSNKHSNKHTSSLHIARDCSSEEKKKCFRTLLMCQIKSFWNMCKPFFSLINCTLFTINKAVPPVLWVFYCDGECHTSKKSVHKNCLEGVFVITGTLSIPQFKITSTKWCNSCHYACCISLPKLTTALDASLLDLFGSQMCAILFLMLWFVLLECFHLMWMHISNPLSCQNYNIQCEHRGLKCSAVPYFYTEGLCL